jgi:penicillin-insensitive murein endopeptidase
LPLSGEGYQVAHPERRRHFGHPDLLGFLVELGRGMHAAKLGRVMLGDLAQPRGGPAPGGHASHQTGLDVDIWYSMPEAAQTRPLPAAALVGIKPRSVLDPKTQGLAERYAPRVRELLRLTAKDPRVERIFVHAGIKRSLCEQTKEDRAWLGKLRPWFGHDDHLHVRLFCPASSPECKPQAPLPAGDGCEHVDWWFSEEGRKDRQDELKRYHSKVVRPLELPPRCQTLVD